MRNRYVVKCTEIDRDLPFCFVFFFGQIVNKSVEFIYKSLIIRAKNQNNRKSIQKMKFKKRNAL